MLQIRKRVQAEAKGHKSSLLDAGCSERMSFHFSDWQSLSSSEGIIHHEEADSSASTPKGNGNYVAKAVKLSTISERGTALHCTAFALFVSLFSSCSNCVDVKLICSYLMVAFENAETELSFLPL